MVIGDTGPIRDRLSQPYGKLKLPCTAQIGDYSSEEQYKLAETIVAVEFCKNAHKLIPDEVFQVLMTRNVDDIRVQLVVHDAHHLRCYIGRREPHVPYTVNVLWHPWLFPDLKFREEKDTSIEACVVGAHGVRPLKQGLTHALKTFVQSVRMQEGIYMCMEPDVCRIQCDPNMPVLWFWSICIATRDNEDPMALVTRHIVLNESATKIFQDVRLAMCQLHPLSVASILKHNQDLLRATQNAVKRLSKVMARCQSVFEGVPIDQYGCGKRYDGPADGDECWEMELRSLAMADGKYSGPVFRDMLRNKVYEALGRLRAVKGSQDEAIEAGSKIWTEKNASTEKAQAIYNALIGIIADLESLSEEVSEMLKHRH